MQEESKGQAEDGSSLAQRQVTARFGLESHVASMGAVTTEVTSDASQVYE